MLATSTAKVTALLLCLSFVGCATSNPAAMRQPSPLGTAVAAAQTPAAEVSVAVQPYLWAAGITGDVRAGSGPGTSVEAGFGDLVENLEGGLMLAGEAWLGREWGVLADVTWMDLSAEGSGPVGNVTVRGETELIHSQVSAMWRPLDQREVVLDYLVGLRLVDVESRLSTNLLQAEVGETLLDPVLGLRATVPMGSGFQFGALVDLGGFGVGTDLSYQLLATIGYQVSDRIAIAAGWREIGLDFDEPDLAMDVAFRGPLLGVRIAF